MSVPDQFIAAFDKRLGGDCQNVFADVHRAQIGDAHELPKRVAQRTAPESEIHRGCHQASLERKLPQGVERADIADKTRVSPPPLAAHAGDVENILAELAGL